MDRAITPHETAVVRWLLDHAAMGDVSAYRQHAPEELRVLEGCKCGCSSLDFAPRAWGGAGIIADALAVYPDGLMAGLILWGREGEVVLLEVYECHPGASQRFPQLTDLRTWEQHGQAQP